MKKALLFLLLVFGVSQGFAQNYAPLQLGVKRYFTNNIGYLRGIRVDSVVQEVGYMRYKTFRTPRITSWSSVFADSNGASWIGQDIREYPNGEWHFPTKNGLSVILRPQAVINEAWAFYTDTSTFWYRAEVVSIDTATVFGVLDTVKKIQLTAMNARSAMLSHPVCGFQILLSKNNGVCQMNDVYEFPYDNNTPDTWYNYASDRTIAGIKAMLFHHVVNWNVLETEIYNFDLNDYFGGEVHDALYYWVSGRYIDSIMGKQVVVDTTFYTIKRWQWGQSWYNQPYQIVSITRNLTVLHNQMLYKDTLFMPEEYRAGGYSCLYYQPNDTTLCAAGPLWETIGGIGSGTYVSLSGLVYPTTEVFRKGLGMTNYYHSNGDGDQWWHDMKFFHKNGVSCGTPLQIPTSVKDVDFAAGITLYPHPANDAFYLKGNLQFPVKATLLNLQQQALSSQSIQDATQPVSTATFPNGLYFLSVKDAAGNAGILKVLVQH